MFEPCPNDHCSADLADHNDGHCPTPTQRFQARALTIEQTLSWELSILDFDDDAGRAAAFERYDEARRDSVDELVADYRAELAHLTHDELVAAVAAELGR